MSYLYVKWNRSGCSSPADVSDIRAWFVLRCPLPYPVRLVPILHHRAAPRGLHNFFDSTSCNIVLSSVSSATSRFSRPFSSCSCLSCRNWSVCSPWYCFFQRYSVCSEMPTWPISSATGTPTSTCLSTPTI
jgi:hypothetical protein